MRTRWTRNRPAIALVTCFLWLLAVEVLPGLHEGLHRDDHSHAADGTIVRVSFGPSSVGRHEHDASGRDVPATSPAPHVADGHSHADTVRHLRHDASGAAHHAVALLDPAPPVLSASTFDSVAYLVECAFVDRLTSSPDVRPSARGPPRLGRTYG